MRDILDYCMVIDNAISPEVCDATVDVFENSPANHEKFDGGAAHFTQLNFTSLAAYSAPLRPMHKYFMDASKHFIKEYQKNIPETEFWPQDYAFEEARIKRYNTDSNDRFDDHCDAISASTCKRFLVFFWYLNDVQQGGETLFLNSDFAVKPRKGRLLMFPPLWLFPHRANKPVSNTKYIMGSYLHFV